MKKLFLLLLIILVGLNATWAAQHNSELKISVDGKERKYVLYVPDYVSEPAPLVFSLHGAAGHSTDRSPFRTSVADSEGCIVVYPQGEDQYFPVFGGYIPGWNSTGTPNQDLDFFKAIIDDVQKRYPIDRKRVYCCGFSNGGMMTYSNASAASDIFAAFASISGFQLNEFHHRTTGYRPVPFLHIHGMADDFVKYSCMPIIRDCMLARNGCELVPEVTIKDGKYRKSVYASGEGGFPYVYYEIEGMGHNDYTSNTEEGNSALTMWRFMSRYTLEAPCDPTLKWRMNLDTEGFEPTEHNWKVSADGCRFEFGQKKKANNADNNVYPSVQLEAGEYVLTMSTEAVSSITGANSEHIYVQLERLDNGVVLVSKRCNLGLEAKIRVSVPQYGEYKLTIVKEDPCDKIRSFEIHSAEAPMQDENCQDDTLPQENSDFDPAAFIEIPQDQGRQYDNFQRTSMSQCDGYTLYTATGDLQIAFKMMDIEVKDCDFIVVKFAQPVAAGWNLAFWEGTSLVSVPADSDQYIFELEPSMLNSGRLPQICMMTFFGGYVAPLEAKVKGVYKHSTLSGVSEVQSDTEAEPLGYVSLGGIESPTPAPGVNIIRLSDGTTVKRIIR